VDLELFAKKHEIKIGTIVDLIHYRIANERTVSRKGTNTLQTANGPFTVHTYEDSISGSMHLAFVKGEINSDDPVLVRVHIPNTLRDVCETYNATRTSWSFSDALERISKEGSGVAVLLSGEDYGKSLEHNLLSALERGMETNPADRQGNDLTIGTGSQILRDIGVGKMRLLSYPARLNAISGFDLEVVEFVQFNANDSS
jgi:3,4-dihydroxy 2-butanone 4-phosphate synthase/GTP cyclohydrolase II